MNQRFLIKLTTTLIILYLTSQIGLSAVIKASAINSTPNPYRRYRAAESIKNASPSGSQPISPPQVDATSRYYRATRVTFKRFLAAINRLDQVTIRIESRISKLEDQGADLSAAKRSLTNGKLILRQARNTLGDLAKKAVINPDKSLGTRAEEILNQVRALKKQLLKAKDELTRSVTLIKRVEKGGIDDRQPGL